MEERLPLYVIGVAFLLVLSMGHATAANVAVSPSKEISQSGHPGQRSLDVDVSSDGDALDNTAITVINDKTKS